MKNNVVLILAPHTDDGEFGCGGTISKLISTGSRVIYVAFSSAEKSVPAGLPSDILRSEVKSATLVLGIIPDDCIVLNYEVRKFPENRQRILDEMIELNQKFKPDMIFMPSVNDTHQDHNTIANEGFRAFKKATILAYEVPWNNLQFKSTCFVEISESDLNKKIKSISKYASQSHRAYASSEYIRSLALVRGVQIGKSYAEVFEVVRAVL